MSVNQPLSSRYLARRAMDFFDWRSGVWEFILPQEELQQEAQTGLYHQAWYNRGVVLAALGRYEEDE